MKPPFSVSGKSYRDSGSPIVSGLSENKSNKPIVSSTNTENLENFSLAGKVIKSLFRVFSKTYSDSNLPLVSKHFENKIDKPIVGSINVSYSPTFSLAGSGQTIREFEIDSVKHVLGRLRTLPGIPLTDDITAFELFSFQLRRTLSDFIDPAGIDDIAFFNTNKGIKDFSVASDDNTLFQIGSIKQDFSFVSESFSFQYTKALEDISSAYESFTFQYSKLLEDTFNADENFTFQYSKLLVDVTGSITDNSVLLFDKAPSDSANASIALNYIVDKVLSDIALGKDLLGVTDGSTFSFGMSESDRVVILEQILIALGVYDYYSDSAQAFDDNLIFNIFKSLDDQAQSFENFTFNFLKTLFDLAQVNENAELAFNKFIPSDLVSTFDTDPTFITNKGLSDLFNIIENAIWLYEKAEFDTSNVNEKLTWLYNKPQEDSAQALEESIWLFNKGQFDTFNISDNQFLNYDKKVSDIAELNDEILTYSLQKVLSDISNALDLVGINDGSTFQFNMIEADLVKISESIQLVWEAFKDFTESIALTENLNYQLNKSISDISLLSDNNIFDVQKVYSDVSQIIELLAFSFNMGNISESLNVGENSVINTGKNPFDTVNVTEIIEILLALKRIIDDTINVSEDLSFAIEKILSDTTLAKDLLGVTDGSTFSFGMVEGDTITSTEDLNLNPNKVLTDLPNIPDDYFLYQQTYFDSDYITNGQAYVVFNYRSELFDIYGLPFTEPLNASENLLLATDKFLNESLTALENSKILFDKPYSDAVNVQELLIIVSSLYKILTDTALAKDLLGVTDGSTFSFGMVEGDIANASETFNRAIDFNRYFNDSSLITENKSIGFNKSATENVNATEVFTKVIDYYRTLSNTLGVNDSSTFTFNMTKDDIANVSESIFTLLYAKRSFVDYADAVDVFTRIVSFVRDFTETVNTPQTYELFSQNYFDSDYIVNGQSYVVFNYRSPLVNIFGLPFTESLQISEIINLYLGKLLSENLSISDDNQITFNKLIVDNTEVSESLFNAISKILTDTTLAKDLLGVTDGSTFTFGMVEGDQININESIFKEVNYNRSFTDQLNTTDLVELLLVINRNFTENLEADQTYELFSQNYFDSDYIINGQSYAAFNYRSPTTNIFGLPFTESLSIPETSVWTFNKDKFDLLQSTDTSTIHVGKNPSDQINISDINPDFVVSKILTDTVLGKDLLGVSDGSTFFFGMSEGDVANASESFTKIVDYNRSFTDQVNTTDLVELLLVINRNFTENLEADQTYELFSQNYFDSDYIINGQSYAAFNYRSPTVNIFGLPFIESLDAEENVIIELDKILSDTFSASENNVINFNKIRTEVINVSETNNLEFNKIKEDRVETSENNVIDFNKAKADQVNVTESFIKSYDKSLTDTPEVTDVIDILVQTLKDFIDSTNVSDPYLIYKQNYFDGDTYSIGYAAYEYRSPTSNGYYLPFTNTANVSETSDLNIGKNQNEQITANDQSNLDIDKDISDIAEGGDSGVVYIQNYFAEDYVEYTYALESTAF